MKLPPGIFFSSAISDFPFIFLLLVVYLSGWKTSLLVEKGTVRRSRVERDGGRSRESGVYCS